MRFIKIIIVDEQPRRSNKYKTDSIGIESVSAFSCVQYQYLKQTLYISKSYNRVIRHIPEKVSIIFCKHYNLNWMLFVWANVFIEMITYVKENIVDTLSNVHESHAGWIIVSFDLVSVLFNALVNAFNKWLAHFLRHYLLNVLECLFVIDFALGGHLKLHCLCVFRNWIFRLKIFMIGYVSIPFASFPEDKLQNTN